MRGRTEASAVTGPREATRGTHKHRNGRPDPHPAKPQHLIVAESEAAKGLSGLKSKLPFSKLWNLE